jgi:hypothetical protein
MSKRSQSEKRQKIEEERQQKQQKFSSTLSEWLQAFAQYYKQETPNETVMLLYQAGLEHLSVDALNLACKESIKRFMFFPKVAEILEALQAVRERMGPAVTTADYDNPPMSEDERVQLAKDIVELGHEMGFTSKRLGTRRS